MTVRYVDPAAGGTNDGTSWTNAWTSFQSAADTAVAGDIVYCRGTQTLAAQVDFDTNSGTNEGGYIKFIGCNSGGTVDGTRFILDCNSAGIHGIVATNIGLIWLENIEVKNTGGSGKSGFYYLTPYAYGWVFINCCANTCSNDGFFLTTESQYFFLFRCVAYSCLGNGFSVSSLGSLIMLCVSRDNGIDGFNSAAGLLDTYIGCIAHNNTATGFNLKGRCLTLNCVSDSNGSKGILAVANTSLYPTLIAIANRITNHVGEGKIGLDCTSEIVLTGFNYFENNDGDNIQNATLHYFIPLEGGSATSNLEDLINTNTGYVDPTNHDFSTGYTDSGDPDLRRTAITLPWT